MTALSCLGKCGRAHRGRLGMHSSQGSGGEKQSQVQRLGHRAVGKWDRIGGSLSLAASVSAERQETRLTAGGREGKQVVKVWREMSKQK